MATEYVCIGRIIELRTFFSAKEVMHLPLCVFLSAGQLEMLFTNFNGGMCD